MRIEPGVQVSQQLSVYFTEPLPAHISQLFNHLESKIAEADLDVALA
jgi:hypothetical protein